MASKYIIGLESFFYSHDGYKLLQLYSSYKFLFVYFLINFLLDVQVRNSTCLDQPAKPAEQALSVATVNWEKGK